MKKRIYDQMSKVEYCGTRVKVCPICKEKFVTAPYHLYHVAGKKELVCSYKCMRESERRQK